MLSYVKRNNGYAPPKNQFSRSVQQDTATSEYRRALLAPLAQAAYGSRVSCPKLVSLAKHVQQGENKVAETTVALSFGALQCGVDIEEVTKPFRVITGMLKAQVPTPNYSDSELHRMETAIEGELNNLQIQYMSGDRSMRVKREMLEKFERIYEIVGKLIDQLRRDIYGGPKL